MSTFTDGELSILAREAEKESRAAGNPNMERSFCQTAKLYREKRISDEDPLAKVLDEMALQMRAPGLDVLSGWGQRFAALMEA